MPLNNKSSYFLFFYRAKTTAAIAPATGTMWEATPLSPPEPVAEAEAEAEAVSEAASVLSAAVEAGPSQCPGTHYVSARMNERVGSRCCGKKLTVVAVRLTANRLRGAGLDAASARGIGESRFSARSGRSGRGRTIAVPYKYIAFLARMKTILVEI